MSHIKTAALILLSVIFFTSCEMEKEPYDINPKSSGISVVEKIEEKSDGEETAGQDEPSQNIYNEYNITLEINPETSIVKGIQKVNYHNRTGERLKTLCFNLYLNAFSKDSDYQPYFQEFRDTIFYSGREYGYINITSVFVDGEAAPFTTDITKLEIDLVDGLMPYKDTQITLQFEAYIPKINHRTGSNRNAMWFGSFIPVVSVYEGGEFRVDPYYKAGDPFYAESANYTVSIKAPKIYKAIGAGNEIIKEGQDSTTTIFTAKMVRDFAFALIDRNYRSISVTTKDGVDINMYYISDIDNVDYIITGAKNAMEFFSAYVGSYPYEKFDIVEAGMFIPAGMEYSQLTFIDGKYLKTASATRTISHEIAHQWFYNVVGSDQIKSPWLDEGLASFLQEKIFYPDMESLRKKIEVDYQRLSAMPALSYKLSDDLSVYKNWSDYYNVQYAKSKIMLYTLNAKMGEENFSKFIKEYYSNYSFKIAQPSDFIKTAEDVYGESLQDFFDTWLYGEKLPPLYF